MPVSKRLLILWHRDGGVCWICGLSVAIEDASRDHYVPRSKGGLGHPNNIRLAHKKCNTERGNGDPKNFPRPARKKPQKKRVRGPKVRGPVMSHITNESARAAALLTTDQKISLQKQDEDALSIRLRRPR